MKAVGLKRHYSHCLDATKPVRSKCFHHEKVPNSSASTEKWRPIYVSFSHCHNSILA